MAAHATGIALTVARAAVPSLLVILSGFMLALGSLSGCASKDKAIVAENPYRLDISQQNSSEYVEAHRYLRLLNTERTRRGLPYLEWSEDLAKVAEEHAQSMRAETEVFSTGLDDLSARTDFNMTLHGVRVYRGRNIFQAYNDLLKTEGEHQQLVSTDFTHVGIGLAFAPRKKYWLFGSRDVYVTQIYAANPKTQAEWAKRKQWDEFIAQQLKDDKTLSTDLNYALFDPTNGQVRNRFENLPPGWKFSAPALQTPVMTYTRWSAHPSPTATPAPPTAKPLPTASQQEEPTSDQPISDQPISWYTDVNDSNHTVVEFQTAADDTQGNDGSGGITETEESVTPEPTATPSVAPKDEAAEESTPESTPDPSPEPSQEPSQEPVPDPAPELTATPELTVTPEPEATP